MTNLPDPGRLSTHDASEAFVESKIQFLMDIGVWPVRERMDPYAWLGNFSGHERPFALNLLNVFLYYNDQLVDALFHGVAQRLTAHISAPATSPKEARSRWHIFFTTVHVTYVEAEDPNTTDSGKLFTRKARQVLGIHQGRIFDPAPALSSWSEHPDSAILLVDDFVGSGDQAIATWKRHYPSASAAPDSFAAAAQRGAAIYYLPLIATQYGLNEIEKKCTGLKVYPAHVLDERYSLIAPNSILWPDALKLSAVPFLFEASKRAGIVDNYKYGWQGFRNLALPLAFSHSVPDATLPLFFWNQNGWIPLISRT